MPVTAASGQRCVEQAGEVARTAAEVDHRGRVRGADPGDQLDERPAALVGVGEVAVGVPGVRHGSLDIKILDLWLDSGAMRDEVDELVEAWARERSDLDLDPVAVFSRISRLARHLDLARREAFSAHDIESWEFDVLAALRRAGAPYELSPGRLLRETLVTSGTMTNRVDRLAVARARRALPRPRGPPRRDRAAHARGQGRRRRGLRGPARRRAHAPRRSARPATRPASPPSSARSSPPSASRLRDSPGRSGCRSGRSATQSPGTIPAGPRYSRASAASSHSSSTSSFSARTAWSSAEASARRS